MAGGEQRWAGLSARAQDLALPGSERRAIFMHKSRQVTAGRAAVVHGRRRRQRAPAQRGGATTSFPADV